MPLPLLPVTVLKAAQRNDGSGFCLGCGAEASGVEPDARNYHCEDCGATQVYGAEEIIISEMLC